MFGKYYKTKLYGFNKDFKINSDDIRESIYHGNKKEFLDVIVKPCVGGFKEIISGKRISAIKIYAVNTDFDLERCIYVPVKPLFVIDDREESDESFREVSAYDLKDYISKYKNNKDSYINLLNKIEKASYNCLSYAIHRHEIEKMIGIDKLRR